MTTDELITALALPDSTRINLRVPKKQLAEQAATTTADKRQINEGIDEITWLAALKPQLIGVPEYRDAHRHYIELAVLGLTLKPGARSGRLTELLHRAVPYPVLLISQPETGLKLSLAHLRTAHNEADKTVLDGDLLSIGAIDFTPDFLAAMALERQPQTDLYALYQGWMDTVGALAANTQPSAMRLCSNAGPCTTVSPCCVGRLPRKSKWPARSPSIRSSARSRGSCKSCKPVWSRCRKRERQASRSRRSRTRGDLPGSQARG
jgi:hypothetical protein